MIGELGEREWELLEMEPKGSKDDEEEGDATVGGRRLSMNPKRPSLGLLDDLDPPRRVELLLARPAEGRETPNIESRMRPPIEDDPEELDLMGERAGLRRVADRLEDDGDGGGRP